MFQVKNDSAIVLIPFAFAPLNKSQQVLGQRLAKSCGVFTSHIKRL